MSLDLFVLQQIQIYLKCAFLDVVMPVVTMLGEYGLVEIVISLVLICVPKTRKLGFKMSLALIFGLLVGNLALKPLVARIRPYDVVTGVELLVPPQKDFSFPSGHTLAAFECAGVALFNCGRKTGIAAIAAASLIAFSRLYLFMHYPTDVIAGIVLGLCFAYLADFTVDVIAEKITEKK